PHEIQVGMLKRLRGTPITRHDENWEMNYSRNAPYEILSNRLLDFETVHRMRRFARYWDVFANSGNFVRTIPLLWESGSPFDRFDGFCEWLYQVEQRTHTIPLKMQVTRLFEYLTAELSLAEDRVAAVLLEDYQRGGRRDIPDVLRAWYDRTSDVRKTRQSLPRRQQRHLRE
ncbi:MAG TPA: B12-binding domain-containing radical SAM protein, partial [Planctomycetaceae bacterium]|nr:B12-binding domain-containing radical SAM protein [Planctomycetaceae bacterium]